MSTRHYYESFFKKILINAIFIFFILGSTLIAENRNSPEAINAFLQNIGFEDYSGEIQKNLDNPPKLINKPGPIAKDVLTYNRDRYTIINDAREIATKILTKTLPNITDPAVRTRIVEFTSRMLNLAPNQLPLRYPIEIENIADEAVKEEQKTIYLTQIIRDQIAQTSQSVFTDALYTMYGEKRVRELMNMPKDSSEYKAFEQEAKALQQQIHNYTYNMYLDPEVGRTKFLGRALAAGVVRESKLSQDKKLQKTLSESALLHGEYLENYVGSEIVYKNLEGKLQTAKIPNGSFIMEYSNGQQAAQLASAVTPGSFMGRLRSFKEKTLGSALLLNLIPDEDKLAEKIAKGKLSVWDKIKMRYAHSEYAKRGYSHMGVSTVKKDAASGVEMAWAYDNYPNADRGGIRFVGIPDQFALQGPFKRFGIVSYDPEKFWEWAQVQYKTNGYRDIVWEASPIGKDGRPKEGTGKRDYKWKVEISKDQFEKIMSWPKSKAKEWFLQEIVPRVKQQFRNAMTRDGTAFAYGFNNMQGAGWCTQTVEMAYLKGTGVDPLKFKDKWALPIRTLKALNSDKVKDIDLDVRTTAPGSASWQTPLIANHTQITFPEMTALEIELAKRTPLPTPMNKASTQLITQQFPNTALPKDFDDLRLQGEIAASIQDYQLHQDLGNGAKFQGARQALVGRSGRLSKEAPHVDFSKTNKPLPLSKLTPEKSVAYEKDARAFLMRLGFEDYSKMAKDTIERKDFMTNLSPFILNENARRYQMVNSARELSVLIMTEMQGKIKNKNTRARLIDLSANFLEMQQIEPQLEIPQAIKMLPKEEREKALTTYITTMTKEQIKTHSLKTTSDILETMYGEENIRRLLAGEKVEGLELEKFTSMQNKIYGLVSQYMDRMYFDTQIGKSRFLGRSLALLLNRQSIKDNDPALLSELDAAVKQKGLYLENFIGSTITVNTEGVNTEGRTKKIKLENGALVLNRSYDTESSVIAASVFPGDKKLAKKFEVEGSLMDAMWATDNTSTAPITDVERLRREYNQKEIGSRGFSHVGYANVLTDPETGIQHTLILDNYPAPTEDAYGGARIVALEHFANQSHYGKLAVANYDHKKFHAFAQQTIKERGYIETVFPSESFDVNEKGKIVAGKKAKAQDWKTVISKEDFERLNSIKDPEVWYQEWSKLYTDHMRRVFPNKYGAFFSWIADEGKYLAGGTYCSQLGEVASLQATGIPIQQYHDKYMKLVKLFNWLGVTAEKHGLKSISELAPVKNAATLPVTNRIIAPSGLVAQPFVRSFEVANYPNMTEEQLASASFMPPYDEMNPDTTKLLAPGLAEATGKIQTAPVSEAEKNARVAAVIHEYAIPFIRGSNTKVTDVLEPDKTLVDKINQPGKRVACAGFFAKIVGAFKH